MHMHLCRAVCIQINDKRSINVQHAHTACSTVLTAADTEQLVEQEAFAAPVWANDNDGHYRARDASECF